MKSFFWLLLCGILVSFSSAYSQDQQMSQEDQMKAWQEYMTPGDAHKGMSEMAGDWTFKMKMWEDPSKDPQLYDGTANFEMLLGGRYLKSVQKGNMMGMPFEGHMIQGFDNKTKEYNAVWYDNFGTGMMFSKGTFNPKTKELTLVGTSVDPISGKEVKMRQVDKMIDKNNHHMEMFMNAGGKEIKSMEIDYTRK